MLFFIYCHPALVTSTDSHKDNFQANGKKTPHFHAGCWQTPSVGTGWAVLLRATASGRVEGRKNSTRFSRNSTFCIH